MNFVETIAALKRAGYPDSCVEEKLAQDIVLKAIGESGLRAGKCSLIVTIRAICGLMKDRFGPRFSQVRLEIFARKRQGGRADLCL